MSEPFPSVRKMSIIMQISDELLRGPDLDRPGHMEPPPADEVEAFKRWEAKFAPLFREGERNGWFYVGGPDYGFEYQPPEDRWVFDDE